MGVDMEWQPTFGCVSAQKVALIQLAVLDQVFLLDLCARGFCQQPDLVGFIRALFSGRNILKLGKLQPNQMVISLINYYEYKQSVFFFLFRV